MKQIFALAASLVVASGGFALPLQAATAIPGVQIANGPVLLVKNDKEKPEKSGKGHGKAKGKDNGRGQGNGHGKAKDHKTDKGGKKDKSFQVKEHKDKDREHARKSRDRSDLDRIAREVLNVQAPKDRDLRVLLGTLPLVLLGLDTVYADIPDNTRLRYRNCPPGLAKKDPPCVPPGLAKQGVTYDQWIDHDQGYYDGLLRQRTDLYRNRDIQPYDDLLLNSNQIANLYNLAPAPYGKRYALIDGMPVLLDADDYDTLLKVNSLARIVNLATGVRPAPTAALTQPELQRLYGLPAPQRGYNYSVVNGEVLSLDDDAFETLQLIRIARAIF